MTHNLAPTRRAWALALCGVLLVAAACTSSASTGSPATSVASNGTAARPNGTTPGTATPADPALVAELGRITQDSMARHHLRSLIVRITQDGREVYAAALGESMTGVPATSDMHIRNGAFAFTYIGTIVAQLVDQKKMGLDDKLSTWMPELPAADKITVKNLLNMTSGYADYVYTDEVLDGVERDPFRQWTGDELIRIGTSKPLEFEPGTNWAYSHTNYVILGTVLEKVVRRPMAEIMQTYIVEPMGLTGTSSNGNTPAIPEPVLHTFSAERRAALRVPADVPFLEETTFWNPSWTTAPGAVQTSTITDMTTSMEVVGSGKLVSPEMYQAQTGKNLVGFGAKDPTGACKVCTTLTEQRSYGLGVILAGPWIEQVKNYAGNGVTGGYLPSAKYAITVSTTNAQAAYDDTGAAPNASSAVFTALATAVAPAEAPPQV